MTISRGTASFVNLPLAGRVALATAGSQGIGLAVAQGLAAEGVRVALRAAPLLRLKKRLRQWEAGYAISKRLVRLASRV